MFTWTNPVSILTSCKRLFPLTYSTIISLTLVFLVLRGLSGVPLGRRVCIKTINHDIVSWLTYQHDQECLWLFTPYKRADSLDPIHDLLGGVPVVLLPHRQHDHLQHRSEYLQTLQSNTLGERFSSSPFCSRHRTFSVLSPDIPKLRECIRQKLEIKTRKKLSNFRSQISAHLVSHILELNKFWMSESPTHSTSGSASLDSVTNRWCWNKVLSTSWEIVCDYHRDPPAFAMGVMAFFWYSWAHYSCIFVVIFCWIVVWKAADWLAAESFSEVPTTTPMPHIMVQ